MTNLKLAWALVFNRDPAHRFRLVALQVAATAFTLLVLSVASVLHLVDREDARAAERQPVISQEPRATDAFAKPGRDLWRDRRIDLVWVQPAAQRAASTALAPGMDHFPEPGEAYVSPELDRLAAQHPELDRRYPHRSVLDGAGLVSGDELLAYVRPPRDRPIGDLADAFSFVGGHERGTGPVVRFSRLGLAVTDRVAVWQVALAALALVLGPGLVLLAVALTTASGLRDRRFQLLEALGARRRSVITLSVLESLIAAVPIIAAVGTVWTFVTPRLTRVPGLGTRVVHGDLGLGPEQVVVALLAELVVIGLFAAALTSVRQLTRVRPTTEEVTLSIRATAPLFLAGLCFAAVPFAESEAAGVLKLVGTGAAVVGAPLVVPGLVRFAGALLGRARGAMFSLAGRSVEWSPKRVSRPTIGVAALLTLFLATAGFVAAARDVEDVDQAALAAPAVVAVQWHHAETGDLPTLREREPSLLWASFYGAEEAPAHDDGGEEHGHDHEHAADPDDRGGTADDHDDQDDHAENLVLAARCTDLRGLLPVRCTASPYELPDEVADFLRVKASIALGHELHTLRLGPPAPASGEGRVLVLGPEGAMDVDAIVRTASTAVLPGPLITSVANQRMWESAVVDWIWAALLLAAVVLVLACLLSLADRIVGAGHQLDRLQAVGMSAGQLRAHQATCFAVPYAAAMIVGSVTGLVLCTVWLSGAPFPVATLVGSLVAASSLGVLVTSGVATIRLGSTRVAD